MTFKLLILVIRHAKWPIVAWLVFALMLLLALIGRAETPDGAVLPTAPKPQHRALLTRDDKWLLLGLTAARAEDVLSTRYCFSHACEERELGQSVAKSTPALISVEAAAVVGQVELTRELRKHGHNKLATASEVIHLSAVVATANYNWTQSALGAGAYDNEQRFNGGVR